MLRTRIIPALLLRDESLVKTVRFGKFTYVGDPCNTVRIFNELEVDELVFLDITATREGRSPNLKILADIANECFMPLGYGGGISSLEQAKAIFDMGFEKVILNSCAAEKPALLTDIAEQYGSQAVITAIDVKTSFGVYQLCERRELDAILDATPWSGHKKPRSEAQAKFFLPLLTVRGLGKGLT